MAIISLTAIHPQPGTSWEEIQKNVKAGNDLIRKHGGENVATMVTMLAGEATGTVTSIWTAPDWARFGGVQNALMADPATQALMVTGGQTASWSTYVSQTIPDM
jgi:hypothetical protein